jgi:hypothetical protein
MTATKRAALLDTLNSLELELDDWYGRPPGSSLAFIRHVHRDVHLSNTALEVLIHLAMQLLGDLWARRCAMCGRDLAECDRGAGNPTVCARCAPLLSPPGAPIAGEHDAITG